MHLCLDKAGLTNTKALLAFLLALLLLLVSSFSFAQQIAVPALHERVTDLTQTLSAQDSDALSQKLQAFEASKGSQIAILIIPTTGEETIEQLSIRIVDEWKLGRKNIDDGALILVAKNDRRMRIEVGRGLEGALPDVIAARIVREYMRPAFRNEDYVGGINLAVDKIISVVQGEELPPPPEQESSGDFSNSSIFGLPLLAWIAILAIGMIVSKIAGAWIGRGGVAATSIAAATFAGTPIGIALVLGVVMPLILSILLTRGFWDILAIVLHSGGGGDGGRSGGGGFSGGGGSFGGGGASGDW